MLIIKNISGNIFHLARRAEAMCLADLYEELGDLKRSLASVCTAYREKGRQVPFNIMLAYTYLADARRYAAILYERENHPARMQFVHTQLNAVCQDGTRMVEYVQKAVRHHAMRRLRESLQYLRG